MQLLSSGPIGPAGKAPYPRQVHTARLSAGTASTDHQQGRCDPAFQAVERQPVSPSDAGRAISVGWKFIERSDFGGAFVAEARAARGNTLATIARPDAAA